MSPHREYTGLGLGRAFLRVVLFFALVLVILSAALIPLSPANSHGQVLSIMTLTISGVTALGSWLLLRFLTRKIK